MTQQSSDVFSLVCVCVLNNITLLVNDICGVLELPGFQSKVNLPEHG